MDYIAHIDETGREQLLINHLKGVGELAAEFAAPFHMEEWAYLIGILHDLGKFSNEYQRRIRGANIRVDHSTKGGQVLRDLIHDFVFSYPILGHHGGLPDGGSQASLQESGTLHARLRKEDLPNCDAYKDELEILLPEEMPFTPLTDDGFSESFLIRMLFSCLVDSDYLDTERFFDKSQSDHRKGYDSIDKLNQRLMNYLNALQASENDLNKTRTEILHECLGKSKRDRGIYSLTVPTGGGKTLSSLAFALNHAAYHGLDRVIYVSPFQTIIEQNSRVFEKALSKENVVQHHSNCNYSNDDPLQNKKYLATENYEAPLVVTTNVQFFESLFASKTSKCRKLHNIANSVIIFDEAQTLPLNYLKPCTRAINELVHSYHSTAVLCTATQPSLEVFLSGNTKIHEIISQPEDLYEKLRRTNVKYIGDLGNRELVSKLESQDQVLCILNTKRHAHDIYSELNGEGAFYLTTNLAPIQRRWILRKIRRRLKQGETCKVVSTSLVEAGVDFDFPAVFRAVSGLDSIIQAAGRCNREGRREKAESTVYIFHPEGKIPKKQSRAVEVFNEITERFDDITSLEAIKQYFDTLYSYTGDNLDVKNIIKKLSNLESIPYKSVSDEFKLIEDETVPVIIPLGRKVKKYIKRLRYGERNRRLLRSIGQYSVNVYKNQLKDLVDRGDVVPLDEALYLLNNMNIYDEEVGLQTSMKGGEAFFV